GSGGQRGGGFTNTNQNSLALGMVVGGDDVSSQKTQSYSFMEKLREHPKVQRFIKGGKTVEYNAHMIPEAGPKMLSRPYTDGMVVAGDAARHLLNNGYTFRGGDMAIQAGVAAAQTVSEARKKKAYPAHSPKVF